jgi:hypothetical protein
MSLIDGLQAAVEVGAVTGSALAVLRTRTLKALRKENRAQAKRIEKLEHTVELLREMVWNIKALEDLRTEVSGYHATAVAIIRGISRGQK